MPKSKELLQSIDITITETLSRTISIDAVSVDEAIDCVKEMYRKEEIILDYSDFDGDTVIEESSF